MPASITTVLQLDDKDLKSKLESVKKYYNETYIGWANATEKVNQKSKELVTQKEKLASAVSRLNEEVKKGNSANDSAIAGLQKQIAARKENIKVLDVEKKALAASASWQKADLSLNKSGIDYLQKQITAKKEATSATDAHTKSTESLANATIRYLRWAGTIAGVVYAGKRAWDATLGTGLEISKMMESTTYGIAALTSANTRMTDSLGNTLTPFQKFAMGTAIATDILKQLRIEAIKTPATFAELTEVYQQAQGHTLAMGDAFGSTVKGINQNTVQLAKSFTLIAGSIGQPMDRVKEEIRSALTGNVSTDSIISTMIFGSPTEANEAIRKAKEKTNGLTDLFDIKFKPFKILEETRTYDKALQQIKDSWQMTMVDMVQKSGMFKDITDAFYKMSESISENAEETIEKFDSFYETTKDIAAVLDNLIIPAAGIASFYAMVTAAAALRAATIALTEAAMLNPYIAAATVIGVGAYTISEYFEDEADRLKQVSKVMATSLDDINKQTAEKLKENRDILGEQLKKANKELTDLRLEAGEYSLLEQLALEPKSQDTRAYEAKAKEVAEYSKIFDLIDVAQQKKIKDKTIAEDELKTLGKKAELLTKLSFDEKLSKDLEEFSKKQQEEKLKLIELRKKAEDDIAKIKKAALKEENQDAESQKIIQNKIEERKVASAAITSKINEINTAEYEKQQQKQQELLKSQKESRDIEAAIAFEKFKQNGGSLSQLEILNKEIVNKYELLELDKKSGIKKIEIQKSELEFQKSITALTEYSQQEELKAEKELEEKKEKARQREEKLLVQKANLLAQLTVEQEKLNSLSVIYSSKQDDILSSYVKQLADIEKQVAKINDLEALTKEEKEKKQELLVDQKKIRDTILAQQAQELENASTFRQTMIETVDIMQDGFQDFFDFSKDRFLDLSKLAKGLGNDILGSFSKNMSSGISTSLMGSIFGAQKSEADLKSMGLSLVGDVYKGTVNGQAVEVDKSGNILSGGNVSSVVSAASGLKSASSLLSGGLAGAIYAPSAGVGSLAGTAYGAGYTGVGSFLGGSATALGGGSASALTGSAYAGALGTQLLVGGAVGYGVGSLGDKLFGADTKAGLGGAIGGAIGTAILPGVGTAIGSVLGSAIGGMFGSTKLKDQGIFAGAETSASMGIDELSRYEDYKKKSWFSSKSWTTFTDLSESEQNKIEGIFESYDYLLSQLGDFEEISVAAGKYTGDTFQDTIVKNLLNEFTGLTELADRKEIYDIWVDYAKEIDKTTSEAITNALSGIVTTERSFAEWALSFGGKDIEALSFKADYLSKDFANLAKMMDAENVTVDNYTESMKKALQENLTPENISLWDQLGNSIMASSDATKAYIDALAQEEQTKNDLAMQAAIASANNISLFLDSLKTEKELAENLASSLGVSLATNAEELASLFRQLAYDIDGLNEAELELLNLNKALLENTDAYQSEIDNLNMTLEDASKAIGTLDGALGTIQSTIEKLRAASRTSEQSLQIYYDAIAEAQRLSTTNLYEDYANAVSKASTATSALFETSNFQTSRDMQFAQLVAANQFAGLEDITITEIDLLEQIEKNTKDAIFAIEEVVKALGAKINQAIFPYEDTVNSAYQSVLGRDAETAGSNYWQEQISAGNVSTSNIGVSIGAAAATNGEISRADYIEQLYAHSATARTAEEIAAGIDYWTNQSETPTTELASLFSQLDPNFQSFAVGTPNVPYDMLAQIHKGEMIPTATMSEGIRRGEVMLGDTSGMLKRLESLEAENRRLRTSLDKLVDVSERQLKIQQATFSETAKVYEAVSA